MENIMPIKIGLIGLGRMGQNHLRILSMLKSVDLVFIFDEDIKKAHGLAIAYGSSAADDLAAALPKVDAVVICSPTETHYDYVLRIGEYVKYIFVEKPLAESLDKTRDLASFVKEKNLRLQVGFIERFNPAVRALRGILDDTSKVINSDFTRTNKLSDRITDVDVIYDLMVHDIDLALHFHGPVKTVNAYGVIHDNMVVFSTASLVHENGCQSRILASRVTEKKIRQIQTTCEDYYVNCELLHKEISVVKQTTSIHEINEPYKISSTEEKIEVMPQEALLLELLAFISMCEGKEVDIPNADDAVAVSEVCDNVKKAVFQLAFDR